MIKHQDRAGVLLFVLPLTTFESLETPTKTFLEKAFKRKKIHTFRIYNYILQSILQNVFQRNQLCSNGVFKYYKMKNIYYGNIVLLNQDKINIRNCQFQTDLISFNTFAASYLNTQGLNNSCLKSPASTLVDLTFQSRKLRSFSLNQLRNLSL